MGNFKDITGQRFGRLIATKMLEYSDKCHSYYWECKCDCGNTIKVLKTHLTYGNTKSCGCLANETRQNNYVDLLNKRFGKIVVTELVGKDKHGHYLWKCKCDCGNEIVRQSSTIINRTRHCGCIKHSNAKTHGKRNTRLYRIWCGIKQRCLNINSPAYKDYGGRGIEICHEWNIDFMNFYNWAIANGYNDNLSIDRINVNGNYEPNNCRWSTMKEQNRNRRDNRFIEINGVNKTISEWVEKFNITYKVFYRHLKNGTLESVGINENH